MGFLFFITTYWLKSGFYRRSLCEIEANVLACDILASELELQLHYFIHFQINTLGRSINPLILPAMD